MRIFGFEIRRAQKVESFPVTPRVYPPPPPFPTRWAKESDRSLRKRQDEFVMERLREEFSRNG